MGNIAKSSLISVLYNNFPIILLFISVMNDFDFNNLELKYFSFNFSYILIFYYTLKKKEGLGTVYLFIAGLFNDVIAGLPMGISSLLFLLLCGFASYLRNITLMPNLIKDWIFFLVTILILNSLSYISLVFIFDYEINYTDKFINILFTFLFYIFFRYLFNFLEKFFVGYSNAR